MTTAHDAPPAAVFAAVARLTGSDRHARLNLLHDPAATEVVGQWIAGEVRPYEPDCVVVWDEPQAVVLAYVVARELGCAAVRAVEAEGLVELVDAPSPARSAVLVADEFAAENSLAALAGLAERHGLRVVAVAAATRSEPLDHTAAQARYSVITASAGHLA
jgi:adenine/guanine phosphoribosyltransferase-like PRPP-binding protein